jgi:hypothetical protein
METAFMDMGQLVVSIGALLAVHCDRFVASKAPNATQFGRLHHTLKNSKMCKGRLLYYYPAGKKVAPKSADSKVIDEVHNHK